MSKGAKSPEESPIELVTDAFNRFAELQRKNNDATADIAMISYNQGQEDAAKHYLISFLADIVVVFIAILVAHYADSNVVSAIASVLVFVFTLAIGAWAGRACARDTKAYREVVKNATDTANELLSNGIKKGIKEMKVKIDQESKTEEVKVKRGPGRPRKEKEKK